MRDISMRTPNAQKYIRLGWAAWEAGEKGNEEEFRRIQNEKNKFCDENFTLEDYDSMIEDSRTAPQVCNMWIKAKKQYITKHKQVEKTKKEKEKASAKRLRKAI